MPQILYIILQLFAYSNNIIIKILDFYIYFEFKNIIINTFKWKFNNFYIYLPGHINVQLKYNFDILLGLW